MGLLGLDFLKSKEQRDIEDRIYNELIYPFGSKQKEKINELLKELIKTKRFNEVLYDYILTKQKIDKLDVINLNREDFKDLVTNLSDNYLSLDSNPYLLLSLALSDLAINDELIYPNKDALVDLANILKNKV